MWEIFGNVKVTLLLDVTVLEAQEHIYELFAGYVPGPRFSTEDEEATVRYLFISNDQSPYVAHILP